MWIRTLIAILLMVSTAGAEWIPSNHSEWESSENPNQFRTIVGMPMQNYQDANGWHEIVNDYINIGDSVLQCTTAIFKNKIRRNGESEITITYEGNDYTISQQLIAIGWLNTDNQNRHIIDGSMNWNNISFNSNIVKWTGVSPGVNYEIRKTNSAVQHSIIFKPPFLDSAVALYNQRADSANISLVNLMKYTLSSNIDNADSVFDNLPMRKLKQLGRINFQIGEQAVGFAGSDTMPKLQVRQYYKRIANELYMLEAVPMNRIKQIYEAYPNSPIWHSSTYQDSVVAGSDDAYLRHGNTWYWSVAWVAFGILDPQSMDAGFRFSSVGIDKSSTINSAYFYGTASANDGVDSCIMIWYGEGADDPATFANDSTAFNTRIATKTTASVEYRPEDFTADVVYQSPDLKTIIQELVNRGGWVNGNDLVLFLLDNGSYDNGRRGFRSRDFGAATAAYLVIDYTTGGAPAVNNSYVRRIKEGGYK